jgi:methyl-accepting chemotaxis protein
MKNLKVSMKLIVSFLLITALAITVGIVGIFSLTSAANNTDLLAERTEIAIIASAMSRNIQAQRASFRGAAVYQAMGMTEKRDVSIADTQALKTEYDELQKSVSAMLITETGLRLMASINEAYAPFASERETYESYVLDTSISNEEMVAQLDNVAATVAPLSESVTALVDFADTLTTDMAIEARTTANRTTVILIVVLVVVAALAILFALYISGLISKPLKDMMGYIKQAGETGNLKFRDDEWANCDKLSQGKDEIGQCMKAFTQMMRKFVYYGEVVNAVAGKDLTITVDTLGDSDTSAMRWSHLWKA